MFKLNKICAISGNADHQCCSLTTNQSINKVNLSEPNYHTNTENWINSDGKSINFSQEPSPQLITQFNKCSLLPLIKAQVNSHTLCAIVDTGATRSLVSSNMAKKLCGENYQQKTKPFQVPLFDVNNKIINTYGILNIDIIINGHVFNQEFIVYQSDCVEILLGFNFMKEHKIAIFPNLGLVFESHMKICNVNEKFNLKCSLRMVQDVTINGGDQHVVSVYLSDFPEGLDQQMYVNGTYLAHSEDLEADKDLQDLSVLHQYVTVNASLITSVLLINTQPAPIVFNKDSVIGHLEPTQIISHVSELKHDPLLYAIYSCFEQSDIHPPESRIFDDIMSFKFDVLDINCSSEAPTHIEFLKDLHLKYKSIFNSEEFCPGKYEGSRVHFSLKSIF